MIEVSGLLVLFFTIFLAEGMLGESGGNRNIQIAFSFTIIFLNCVWLIFMMKKLASGYYFKMLKVRVVLLDFFVDKCKCCKRKAKKEEEVKDTKTKNIKSNIRAFFLPYATSVPREELDEFKSEGSQVEIADGIVSDKISGQKVCSYFQSL